MKRILLSLFGFIMHIVVSGQTNIFPSTGNVGIGTTSPTEKLHVDGNSLFTGRITFSTGNNSMYSSATATTGYLFQQVTNTGGGYLLGVNGIGDPPGALASGSSGYSTVLSTINVTPLHFGINHVVKYQIDEDGNSTWYGNGFFNGTIASNNDENSLHKSISGFNISTGTSAVNRLRLGNNTSNQLFTIDVFGGNHSSKPNVVEIFNQYTNLVLGGYGVAALMLGNNGNATFQGNVGIGISEPTEKLSVNGNIRAKKIIVSKNAWPDYVFEPSHIIRPLSELEKFIKENKHLPEIPSAREIEKNGIDIGDNQALLLKKIEELTLYVIELKKITEKQQFEINQLKKKK